MSRDDGLSLVELLISIFLIMIVSVVFYGTLSGTLTATRDFEGVARSNDSVRLVLQQIDREFRSAEQICEPLPGLQSDRLEFKTRSFTATTTASGIDEIVYELRDGDGDGLVDEFQRSGDGGVTWRTVIDGVVNATYVDDDYNASFTPPRPAGTPGVFMFETQGNTIDAAPSEGKVVTVRIWVDDNPADRIDPRLATTEISGRNIWTPNAPGC